tara:strand:+ start:1264 stop:1416 length:153 start_codon:yes stop_codon:yes gene_type:complete
MILFLCNIKTLKKACLGAVMIITNLQPYLKLTNLITLKWLLFTRDDNIQK